MKLAQLAARIQNATVTIISTDIQAIRTNDEIRWILPFHSATHPFRGTWKNRVLSWFLILFGLVFIGSGVWVSWDYLVKIPAGFPLNPFQFIKLLGLLCAVGFYGVAGICMGCVCILQAFPGHTEVVLTKTHLHEIFVRGAFRWRRRYPLSRIEQFKISTPPTSGLRSLQKPLNERPACILLEMKSPTRAKRVAVGYKHLLVEQLLVALSLELQRQQHDPLSVLSVASVPKVTPSTQDEMAPDYLNADDFTPPIGSHYSILVTQVGLSIQEIRSASETWRMTFKMPMVRGGFIGLAATLLICWVVAKSGLFVPPENLSQICLIGVLFSCAHMMLALFLWMHFSYHVTAQHLIRTTHFLGLRWSRRIPRASIAALRIGYRTGDENAVRKIIEILKHDGTTKELTSGGIPFLRFLSSHLRKALNVPAIVADLEQHDPNQQAYHQQDQSDPPIKRTVTTAYIDNAVILKVSRLKQSRKIGTAQIVCTVFILIGLTLAIFIAPRMNQDDFHAVIAVACLLGGVGLLLLVADTYERYISFLFIVGPDSVTYGSRSIFGTRRKIHPRKNLIAIRTDVMDVVNPYKILLIYDGGKAIKLASYNEPDTARYIATHLRKVMNLPANP